MEEALENDKESVHSARANGNEWKVYVTLMAVLLAAVYNVFYVISYFQGLCDVVHISLVSFYNRKTLQLYVVC
jgi:hypothetical protein